MTTFAGQLIQRYPPTGELAVRSPRHTCEEIKQRYSSGNILIVSHSNNRIMLCSLLIDVGRFRYRLDVQLGQLVLLNLALMALSSRFG